ncbi:MAG: MBL fold metallo-hydrolase, partial [Rhodanobacter sp.]
MNWHLHFLGVGAAHATALGSSSAVLERDGKSVLLIDCGPDTLDRYVGTYGELPY